MGRIFRGPLATPSTRASAEYESDPGKVTPCYPPGRWVSAWIEKAAQSPRLSFRLGLSSQAKLREHVGIGMGRPK